LGVGGTTGEEHKPQLKSQNRANSHVGQKDRPHAPAAASSEQLDPVDFSTALFLSSHSEVIVGLGEAPVVIVGLGVGETGDAGHMPQVKSQNPANLHVGQKN
jgi:hypothetical protein